MQLGSPPKRSLASGTRDRNCQTTTCAMETSTNESNPNPTGAVDEAASAHKTTVKIAVCGEVCRATSRSYRRVTPSTWLCVRR